MRLSQTSTELDPSVAINRVQVRSPSHRLRPVSVHLATTKHTVKSVYSGTGCFLEVAAVASLKLTTMHYTFLHQNPFWNCCDC